MEQTRGKYCEKAGKRLYMLYQLKRAGITQKDVVSVYVSVARPVLEYACAYGAPTCLNMCLSILKLYKKGHYNVFFLDWVTRRYLDVLTLIH